MSDIRPMIQFSPQKKTLQIKYFYFVYNIKYLYKEIKFHISTKKEKE